MHLHPASEALLAPYRIRVALCIAATLCGLLVVIHLPIEVAPTRIGWHLQSPPPPPHPEPRFEGFEGGGGRPSSASAGVAASKPEEPGVVDEAAEGPPAAPEALPAMERMKGLDMIHEYAEQPPDLVGGMGSFYLNILYPEAAQREGIEGRLILNFVVEKDGSTSGIEVAQSLHPLCDSAAVEALRVARFVPGKQNGETVRVRMRLPVRFRLIQPSLATKTEGEDNRP